LKISFLSGQDFANVLTEYSFCLNKHSDIKSKSICTMEHPFKYKIEHDYNINNCNITQLQEIKEWILGSDVLILSEESPLNNTYQMLEIVNHVLGINLLQLNKKIIIWHPGSNYRNNFHYYNNHPLRGKVYKHLYAIDLYRLSPKNKNDLPLLPYQYFDFNYDTFISKFKEKLNNPPWTILHIPSNASIKGTSIFELVIDNLDLDSKLLKYKVLQNIPYTKVIEEKKKSIFYLDQINEECGGYGLASLEAIFSSNLTFSTMNNSPDSMYRLTNKHETPVVPLSSNIKEVEEILTDYIKNISKESLIECMQGIGRWVEDTYKPEIIVKQFKEIIG